MLSCIYVCFYVCTDDPGSGQPLRMNMSIERNAGVGSLLEMMQQLNRIQYVCNIFINNHSLNYKHVIPFYCQELEREQLGLGSRYSYPHVTEVRPGQSLNDMTYEVREERVYILCITKQFSLICVYHPSILQNLLGLADRYGIVSRGVQHDLMDALPTRKYNKASGSQSEETTQYVVVCQVHTLSTC